MIMIHVVIVFKMPRYMISVLDICLLLNMMPTLRDNKIVMSNSN